MAGDAAEPERDEEQRLVRAAACGDGPAFTVLWQRHARSLLAYARRRTGDPAQAEDLVQEVFVALIRHGSTYVGQAPLRAWLFRVARNRIANLWRDARPSESLPDLPGPQPVPELVLAVRAALARLPEVFREPILLLTYEQLSYEEIAHTLACPIGTVRSRISRGKRLMAEMLATRQP